MLKRHFRTAFAPLLFAALLLTSCAPQATIEDAPEPAAEAPSTTPEVYDDPDLVRQYQDMITPEDLASHLFVFASDYFEGRETATRGQYLAAKYLAGQYRKMGLEPRGTAEADHRFAPQHYYQPFNVYGDELNQTILTVLGGEDEVFRDVFTLDHQDGHSYLQFGDVEHASGSVVFGGYGIADDELGYNDYAAMSDANVEIAGNWLLILDDEPLAEDGSPLLDTEDGEPTRWTDNLMNKYRPALQSGVAGVLIVGDSSPLAEQSLADQARDDAISRQHSIGSVSLEPEEQQEGEFPPIFSISSEMANEILAPSGRSVSELRSQIDDAREPEVFEIDGRSVQADVSHRPFEKETENVLAFIEGSDPELRDEVIVFTAHYDHLGMDPTLDNPVYNGADDDGSGTVALLEIAESFRQAKDDGYGPRRSILFLSVSAEEKGLLGSEYYADYEPVFPLENTVANFNLDMIGRSDPDREEMEDEGDDYVYIIGSRIISEDLDDILVSVNEQTGINMTLDHTFNTPDDPNQFYRRSDQWNFGKHDIPFIFYFTGTHEDYHQPGDEPHKIDYDKHARITRLVFATAWQVANQDERPEVTGEGFH